MGDREQPTIRTWQHTWLSIVHLHAFETGHRVVTMAATILYSQVVKAWREFLVSLGKLASFEALSPARATPPHKPRRISVSGALPSHSRCIGIRRTWMGPVSIRSTMLSGLPPHSKCAQPTPPKTEPRPSGSVCVPCPSPTCGHDEWGNTDVPWPLQRSSPAEGGADRPVLLGPVNRSLPTPITQPVSTGFVFATTARRVAWSSPPKAGAAMSSPPVASALPRLPVRLRSHGITHPHSANYCQPGGRIRYNSEVVKSPPNGGTSCRAGTG